LIGFFYLNVLQVCQFERFLWEAPSFYVKGRHAVPIRRLYLDRPQGASQPI
jgi:hypothetical protein